MLLLSSCEVLSLKVIEIVIIRLKSILVVVFKLKANTSSIPMQLLMAIDGYWSNVV